MNANVAYLYYKRDNNTMGVLQRVSQSLNDPLASTKVPNHSSDQANAAMCETGFAQYKYKG